jgi:hypothetical protein
MIVVGTPTNEEQARAVRVAQSRRSVPFAGSQIAEADILASHRE